MTVQTLMYVLTDANANNNKFWEISRDETGRVSTRNGRVGTAGQHRVLGAGDALFHAKIREKERKGYKRVEVLGQPSGPGGVDKAELIGAAEAQIGRGDPVISALVRQLAEINRHQIIAASGGQMSVDLATGIVSTPVGVVTLSNIRRARDLLIRIEPLVRSGDFDSPDFLTPLEEYLMLVPQKVGTRRGWHRDFLAATDALARQGTFLDQLEGSIEIAEDRLRKTRESETGSAEAPRLFDVSMRVSEDPGLRARILAFFQAGRHAKHASSNLRVARIFEVTLGDMDRQYREDGLKVGGIRELWHGTRAHNLLSILKSGLIVPRENGSIHVTGRMFGNGVYFSDQSTKSLNYAAGYWDGKASEERCFMFLADVAMGRPWHPDRTGASVRPPAGYDSVFARGGQDRVLNNEMIVYRTSQVNLKYLVEFEK